MGLDATNARDHAFKTYFCKPDIFSQTVKPMTIPNASSMTKETTWPCRVAIVGVGLLGGSVSKSIRRELSEVHVTGVVRDIRKGQQYIDIGVIDSAEQSIEVAVKDAEVVVVSTPVDRVADFVSIAAEHSPDNCLITDVGSTKRSIVEAVSQCEHARAKFVAAHPIAGSEKTGAENALADLFDDKTIVLTPDRATSAHLISRAKQFWSLTRGRIMTLSPADHDTYLASVSHVPHLASSAVAQLVASTSDGTFCETLVGSGWLDMTRVAAGDPAMWLAICQENREAVKNELERLRSTLAEVGQMLDQHDDIGLEKWLSEAKQFRDRFK